MDVNPEIGTGGSEQYKTRSLVGTARGSAHISNMNSINSALTSDRAYTGIFPQNKFQNTVVAATRGGRVFSPISQFRGPSKVPSTKAVNIHYIQQSNLFFKKDKERYSLSNYEAFGQTSKFKYNVKKDLPQISGKYLQNRATRNNLKGHTLSQ